MNKSLTFVFTVLLFILSPINVLAMNTSEALSSVFKLSSQAVSIGKLAQNKLQDPQLKEFNQRMIGDHQISLDSMKDLAKQMNISVPAGQQENELKQLDSLQGKAFEKQYIDKEVKLHEQLLSLVKDKIIPATNSPIVKKVMQNYAPRISALLDNARKLSGLLGPMNAAVTESDR